MYAQLIAAGNSGGLNGPEFPAIALAVANAVALWIPSVATTGISKGSLGGGTVTGTVIVPPFPGMLSVFIANGVQGPNAAKLASVISTGVSQTQYQYKGLSTGVGIGSDTCKITSAPAGLLSQIIKSQLQGASSIQVCNAIAYGISGQFLLATGTGIVTGSPSSASGTGSTIGTLTKELT